MNKNSFDDIYLYSLLTDSEKMQFKKNVKTLSLKKGDKLSSEGEDCLGFYTVLSGQIRAYNCSSSGRELTLFRLIDKDSCFITAACMMSVKLDVSLSAEKDSEILLLPTFYLKSILDSNIKVALYSNQMIATRLQEVVWIIDQTLFKSFDTRLALFLLEESSLEQSMTLKITHDKIANHLGTAREVVSRMLKLFKDDEIIKMYRGVIEIRDNQKLIDLSKLS